MSPKVHVEKFPDCIFIEFRVLVIHIFFYILQIPNRQINISFLGLGTLLPSQVNIFSLFSVRYLISSIGLGIKL